MFSRGLNFRVVVSSSGTAAAGVSSLGDLCSSSLVFGSVDADLCSYSSRVVGVAGTSPTLLLPVDVAGPSLTYSLRSITIIVETFFFSAQRLSKRE